MASLPKKESGPSPSKVSDSKPKSTSRERPVTTTLSDDDESGPNSATSWRDNDAHSPDGSLKSEPSGDESGQLGASGDGLSLPVQKRRRVTRACDECRRKKIKCDGKQPCTHCSVYSYECTYDKPSNRRRNPAPQYIEALESRLQRAESLLRKYVPDIDLSDPTLDPAVQQEFRNREQARAKLRQDQGLFHDREDGQILSMIQSIGQLDLDDKGGWDFHGTSSGAVFLRRMREHFRGMLGPVGNEKAPFLPRPERPPGLINLDSPQSPGGSPFSSVSQMPDLPPKEVALNLCYYSLSCATCLIRIVHVPTFYERLDKLYETDLENLSTDEQRFMGLLFAIMALGCMYNISDETSAEPIAYKDALDQGLKYYNNARHILNDITECRDMTSLQALLFMILFLQATSNLSGCYAFVGIALRSALRMGLHRHLRHEQISPIEQEVRRRVFYVIRQMDIYISALLGFPLLLNVEDIDQPYPTEVDDEYITKEAILQQPPGTASFLQAFNAHTRLMETLAKVIKYVYPMKGLSQSVMKGDKPNTTYMISYARIREIETELHQWYERLPEAWRPSTEGSVEAVRVRHLLRFAYAHVQLVLYRPFLHYVSPRLSMGSAVDDLSYACAAASISVSRNIVHIGLEIRKQAVLIGPYWFMLYTEFFAVLSLVFYAIENPEKPGSGDVLGDATAGWEMVAQLAGKSVSADRVTRALTPLFEQIPERLREARARPIPTKKRSMHGAQPSSLPISTQAGIQAEIRRQTEDRARARANPQLNGGIPHQQTSFDGIMMPDNPFHDPAVAASLQDLLPIDLSLRATPDSSSTGGSSSRHKLGGLNKLDSLMFPSDDPFAYPNQPMMELGSKRPARGTEPPDAAFLIPGSFDDMDGQLLGGQIPPYLMQEHGQPGFGIPAHGYGSTGMPAGMSAGMSARGAAAQSANVRRAQMQRQHDRELEHFFAQQNYQSEWSSSAFPRGSFSGL